MRARKEEAMNYINSAPLAATLEGLQQGQHSLSIYLEQMCRRIDQIDPNIHAFLTEANRLGRLRSETGLLRERFPDRIDLPPLFGAMVGVKDIFQVDGFVTHGGSELPAEALAGPEAKVVSKLREVGALIAGKTVTTEFAFIEPGATRNPHNPAHTPGGSSSGSAAAVAAGMCNLALGTQTIGSVIRPAAYCGIVGFKPSYDRIPSEGILYFSRSVDHVGLFTQDVEGMAIAAAALCQNWRPALADPEDGAANELPVLGVPDGPYLSQVDPAALAVFEEILLMLQVAGCTVKRVAAFENINALNTAHRRLIFGEFAREHAELFAKYEALYRPRTVEAIRTGQSVNDEELAELRKGPRTLRAVLQDQMAAEEIDLWICPSATGPAPVGLNSTGDSNMSLPWTHTGMPAITLPAGRAQNGLPLGMQLIAPFEADEQLMAWAKQVMERVPEPVDADVL
jgi:Asp-tRNA(Asn)/Glu-tRNA(Gln) amidotransferase A subunit family amidase